MSDRTRNFLVAAGVVGLFVFYLLFASKQLPVGNAQTASTIGLLLLIGLVFGLAIKGPLWAKMLFALVLPATHLVAVGIDQAKIGLTFVVWFLEVLVPWIATIPAHLLQSRRVRKSL
jgi:hypothetical protein